MNRFLCNVASLMLLSAAAAAQDIPLQVPLRERQQLPESSSFLLQEGSAGWVRTNDGGTFFTVLAGGEEQFKNAPYTATAVTESTQTLVDGNRIVHKNSTFLARDSQGRTRHEETISQMGSVRIDGQEKVVLIHDPTANTSYIIDPRKQIVRVIKNDEPLARASETLRRKLEGIGPGDPAVAEAVRKKLESTEPGDPAVAVRKRLTNDQSEEKALTGVTPEKKHEDLGVQQMEGVNCQHRRDTITIAAGAEGNERPLQIVSETCYSEELHALVLRKHSDPRFGDTEYRLTNIKLGEPDASLFQVPANFKSINVVKPLPRD